MTDKFTAIIKEAQDIMSNLFEVEYYGANDVEEEQNNKIKRQGKDKHGNKVDLVSVQDELFPYEGNAKEQYNKKIIAKINDMIEGKATLEDLIQLVRNKKTPVKEGFEGAIELLEAMINEVSKELRFNAALSSVSPRFQSLRNIQKDKSASSNEKQNAEKRLNQAKNIISTEGEGGLVTNVQTEKVLPSGLKKVVRRTTATPLDRKGAKENDDYRAGNTISWTAHRKSLGEALSILEEIINEISQETADTVTAERRVRYEKARDRYNKTRDGEDLEKLEKETFKDSKNSELRDNWDILKGIGRGKDGKFHNKDDYREYKEKYGRKGKIFYNREK